MCMEDIIAMETPKTYTEEEMNREYWQSERDVEAQIWMLMRSEEEDF